MNFKIPLHIQGFKWYNGATEKERRERKEHKMMRQITMFKFEVGTKKMVERPDGLFEKREEVCATVEATSLTKTEIRAAILAAGVACPRGTDVFANKVGRILLKFDNDDLMSIVKEREELPL